MARLIRRGRARRRRYVTHPLSKKKTRDMSSAKNDTATTVTQLNTKLKKRHDKSLQPPQQPERERCPWCFRARDVEWPRWSLTLKAYLGSSVGTDAGTLELCRRSRTKTWNPETTCWTHSWWYFTLAVLFKKNLMEKLETAEHGEGLRLLVADLEQTLAVGRWCCSRASSISLSVQLRICYEFC